MRLKDFQRNLAKEIFGVDMDRSINDRVCVSCGKPCSPDNIRDQAEVMEFFKSGLCGVCFDRIFEVLTEEEVALYRLAQSEEKE